MIVKHLANSTLSNFNTGYTTFIESVLVKTQRDMGYKSDIINCPAIIDNVIKSNKIEYLYENLFVDKELRNKIIDDLNCLIYPCDILYIHNPVSIPIQFLDTLDKKKVIVILHDIAPFIPHNCYWNMECTNPLDIISQLSKNGEFCTEEQFLKIDYKYNLLDSLEAMLSLKPFSVSDRLVYYKYLLGILKFLNKTLNIAPSEFMASLYQSILNKKPEVIAHSSIDKSICTKSNKKSNNIISIFAWEKFDIILYFTIVKMFPNLNFHLLVEEKIEKDYLRPFKKGYGLPKNLFLKQVMSQAEYMKFIESINPFLFFHISLTSESYGLILDDMKILDIPTLVAGNYNALQERIMGYNFIELYTGINLRAISAICYRIKDIFDNPFQPCYVKVADTLSTKEYFLKIEALL